MQDKRSREEGRVLQSPPETHVAPAQRAGGGMVICVQTVGTQCIFLEHRTSHLSDFSALWEAGPQLLVRKGKHLVTTGRSRSVRDAALTHPSQPRPVTRERHQV